MNKGRREGAKGYLRPGTHESKPKRAWTFPLTQRHTEDVLRYVATTIVDTTR
jgi:hypothetical protein